jgi:hypothetical protein
VQVYATGGKWRVDFDIPDFGHSGFSELFDCSEHARLATEKWYPPKAHRETWLESMRGGFIRCFDGKNVHVRQANLGWYAARADGKILGRNGDVAWFTTAAEVCNAVEQEWYMPAELDPFAATKWSWIKLPNKGHARAA